MMDFIRPIEYKDGQVILLDQTRLPVEEVFFPVKTREQMWEAIKRLQVRGAPAIGIAAAYGVCVDANAHIDLEPANLKARLVETCDFLSTSRPTAVNLFWAMSRIRNLISDYDSCENMDLVSRIEQEARCIEEEEARSCISIGENLLSLLKDGMGLLTHCNAGGIATIRYGTALAPMLLGKERGIEFHVYADETRPLLQGARLTSWELQKAGVDVTLITDSMAASVMKQGRIDAVIVGCDRVAANGDFANKIGTYSVAILAKEHGIPFYVAAPTSTIDMDTASGDEIVIEEREPEEITCGFGKRTAPVGVKVYNPAFDVTPAGYVTAIVTEKGILRPPYAKALQNLMENS